MTQEDDSYEPFNLYLAGNIVHGLTTFLEKIAEQCANKFQIMLSHTLNAEISVMPVVEVEQMILHANHDDCFLRTWVINNEDPMDLSVVALDRGIITACLDLMCGGNGEYPDKTQNVAPSMGDRRMAYKLMQGLFRSFEESFESINPVKFRMTNKSEDAAAEQLDRSAMDFVVCIYFIISIGDISGSVQLLFPANSLTKMGDTKAIVNRKEMKQQLEHRMLDVSIPMTAKLGQQETTLRKALSIKAGDIIPLFNPIDADVFVGDRLFCKAQVMTDNNKLLLKIAGSDNADLNDSSKSASEPALETKQTATDAEGSSSDNDTGEMTPRRSRRRSRSRSRDKQNAAEKVTT
ncbi:hypothetical protein GZ77_06050 [Endozoicomonas montiporae]|uniref:Flagellar motor switch protein FliM n=2 Tax=Endozoicomonas montiporae TaxID=1027273 RepID=A0A081NC53_9GAMM|nr:FliM/FliN family flagellar motor switch protein [Endozoicomonas montiporae]AMO56355.1 flagellar motor switch protein FliM [Endozoicomonas montiporae CL-33]KEQ16026.1 hypothetical protein GZ77_06050 [Endozoicomonas montiporae]